MSNMIIRKETKDDFLSIEALIIKAFENEEYSDHKEQELVKKIRASKNYLPNLTLVAEIEGKIVGFIMLSEIEISNEKEALKALALAPVCVLPEFQNQGIGAKLIKTAENNIDEAYAAIVILGHPDYYPKFGYQPSIELNIKNAFADLPNEYFMAKTFLPLSKEFFVTYPDYFLEN